MPRMVLAIGFLLAIVLIGAALWPAEALHPTASDPALAPPAAPLPAPAVPAPAPATPAETPAPPAPTDAGDDTPRIGWEVAKIVRDLQALRAEAIPAGDYPRWIRSQLRRQWRLRLLTLEIMQETTQPTTDAETEALREAGVQIAELGKRLRPILYPGTPEELDAIDDATHALRRDVARFDPAPANSSALQALRAEWRRLGGLLRCLGRDPEQTRRLNNLRIMHAEIGEVLTSREGLLPEPYSDAWWEQKCQIIEEQHRAYLQLVQDGSAAEAARKKELLCALLENLRLVTPELGGPKFAPRFRAIAREIELVRGWEPEAQPR